MEIGGGESGSQPKDDCQDGRQVDSLPTSVFLLSLKMNSLLKSIFDLLMEEKLSFQSLKAAELFGDR